MTIPPAPRSTRMPVEGTYNFREAAPGLLRPGMLYRSDALHRLSAAGRATLRELGIVRVIDLRSPFDRRLGGRDRLRGVGAEYISIPILGAGRNLDPATITLRSVYRTALTDHGHQIGAAIRAVADADGPVVVHCTAGKDRTGLVTALILLGLGMTEDEAVTDFASSADNLAGEWTTRMLRKVRWFRISVTDDVRELLSGSPEAALRDTLRWLDEEYGGVAAYLAHVGVDADVLSRLGEKLAR